MQDYALAAYTFFANIDEMRLNPHTTAGMYRDYDSVKDTVVAMGTYMWKCVCGRDITKLSLGITPAVAYTMSVGTS